MAERDPRLDTYIANSAEFAKPVLTHFRNLMHKTCPDLKETIRWGFPHFDYHQQPLSSIAAFKKHCAITFWKASLMKDAEKLVGMAKSEIAMGHLGKIGGLKDLPKDSVLSKYIKEGMKLNKEGKKLATKTKQTGTAKVETPDYFMKALLKNKKALKTFEAFSNTNKKEYIDWVSAAKTEETRNNRLQTSIGWLSEGKTRNWKYLKKKN